MQIAGIQKTTLVDYPGKVAATIFTRGCSFRCPFCHNPELVIPEQFNPLIPEDEILNFLNARIGKLEGVCITGGEPTIQPDINEFIRKVKEMGFLVKLDTNGSRPTGLEPLISSGNLDYIAMDIKAAPNKYLATAGIMNQESRIMDTVISTHPEPTVGWTEGGEKSDHASCYSRGDGNLAANIQKSISLIMNSGIDYEFRTTVCHPIHEVEDFEEIGKLIKGAKRYYIQNFVKSKQISEHQKFKPFTDEELEMSKKITEKYIEMVRSR